MTGRARRAAGRGVTARFVTVVAVGLAAALAAGLAGVLGAGLGAVHGASALPASGEARTHRFAAERAGRLLVFSLPDVTWADLRDTPTPNVQSALATAAMANLAGVRIDGHTNAPADPYVTLSAGSRAVGVPPEDGDVLAPGERIYGIRAGDLFERRTGRRPNRGLVAPGWPAVVRRNADLPYDARPGWVAALLARSGVARAVIGNADGGRTDDDIAGVHREVGLALANTHGEVSSGTTGPELVRIEPGAPLGVRSDQGAYERAFAAEWGPGPRVVVVEASDLARVSRAASLDRIDKTDSARRRALLDADRLFGAVLARADLGPQDALLVVGMPTGLDGERLGVAALQAPGVAPGWLQSPSTQRDGVLSTVDLGPTVLDLMGLEAPPTMEGRPARARAGGTSYASRVDRLVDDARGAEFRDGMVLKATVGVLILLVLLALAVLGVVEAGWTAGRNFARALCALCVAYLPATYLVQLLPGHDSAVLTYFVLVALIAVVLSAGLLCLARPALALGVGAALGLAVLMADVIAGGRLQFNAVFGYSPGANSRLYGASNYALGQVLTGSLVVAAVLMWRHRARGRLWAALLLAAVLLVIGMPFWGADVGGVLAATPTFLVFLALSAATARHRARALVLSFVAALPAIALFAVVDLARPVSSRTHLGRLLERVDEEGLRPLAEIVGRKLGDAFSASLASFWLVTLPVAVGFLVLLTFTGSRPLGAWRRRVRPLRIAVACCALGAFLGSVLNDSGAIVAAVLAATLAPLLGLLALEPEPGPESGPDHEPAPSGHEGLGPSPLRTT